MLHTYEEYLTSIKALPIEQMHQIHMKMADEIGRDADALELYDELLEAAVKYAEIRAKWLQMDRETKNETDSLRTSRHDAVIRNLNMLARYLKTQGKAGSWREQLGYEEDNPYNRKAIGDFACYLVFVNSLNAR